MVITQPAKEAQSVPLFGDLDLGAHCNNDHRLSGRSGSCAAGFLLGSDSSSRLGVSFVSSLTLDTSNPKFIGRLSLE